MATKVITRYRTRRVRARSRSRSGFTIPVAVVAGLAPLTGMVIHGFQTGGINYALKELCVYSTGYIPDENKWSFAHLAKGMGPVLAGIVVHKLAGRLGVNRALSRAGVPFVRI